MSRFNDDLTIAGTVVGILVGVGGIAAAVRSLWGKTLGARRDLARGLNRLASGMPSEGLETLLGPCSLRRPVDGHPQIVQQVYWTKYACVDLLVETATNTVTGFCITATNRRFRFRTAKLTFGCFDVILGHSMFAQVRATLPPEGVRWWNGARDAGYVEAYYVGNPGGYQHYLFAYRGTGHGAFGYDHVPDAVRGGYDTGTFEPSPPRLLATAGKPDWSTFRSTTVVNTLQILGPGCPLIQGVFPRPGVHGDMLRLLRDRS